MSNLLCNDHNVYILGAGFSRDGGLPLISDFLFQMRDSYEWLSSKGRHEEARAIDKVLKFRLEAASAAYWVNTDLENIEELFSLAFANQGGITDAMRLAIAATLDYAKEKKKSHELGLTIRYDGKLFTKDSSPQWLRKGGEFPSAPDSANFEIGAYAWRVAHLLGMLDDGKPQGENSFITFNYDTLLEEAIQELNLPTSYGSQFESPFNNGIDSSLTKIPVLKMHGSVNWARSPRKNSPIKAFWKYRELLSEDRLPELVPPTWKKVFEKEIESVWEEAIRKLTTATRIIIIGFSMPPTDMHFKYLLASGLKQNISLRQMLFVNPDTSNELRSRAETMLKKIYIDSGRIDFLKKGLAEFASKVPTHVQGLHQLGRPIRYGLHYDERELK